MTSASDAAQTATFTFEQYLANYAADFYEFSNGALIKMSPVHLRHVLLTRYLWQLLEAYFGLRPIGQSLAAPYVMRLPNVASGREPDLFVVLNTNPYPLRASFIDGPADLVIEIVSPESFTRDHSDKFQEYEQGHVPEYWILDPLHKEARFFRLNETNVYIAYAPDEHGNYTTPTLPDFVLSVPTLWQDTLPTFQAVSTAVRAMLEQKPNDD